MPTTDVDIVNQALFMVDQRIPLVTGVVPTFDNSAAGRAAQLLYEPSVRAVARLWEWDMGRRTIALVLSTGVAPFPWSIEYLYPVNGVQVWQVIPATLEDPNNPAPLNWVVANADVGGEQKKVIHTNVAGALAVYNNNPGPDVWDPGFQEAVVRFLASKFAESLQGRPDTAQTYLTSSSAAVDGAKARDS